jgi:alkaline phosphatase
MQNNGYSYVTNKTDLEAVSGGKILGIFSDGHMDYELERNYSLTPSIVDMTRKALEVLQQNSSGFFLMVEGGRIDHAGHANNKTNSALEGIAFDYAVREALNYVKNHDNTILIVTADHETGGLAIVNENLDQNLPISGLTEEQNETIRITRVNQIDVTWSTTGHTDLNVPFWGYGIALENFTINSLIDNTEIFDLMKGIIVEPEDPIEDPIPPTPTYITPSSPPPTSSSISILIIIVPIALTGFYFLKLLSKSFVSKKNKL